MRPATEAPARSVGLVTTVSPSTSRTGRNATSLPGSWPSSSTSTRSPSATRACLPPVWMTAYIGMQLYRGSSGFRKSLSDRSAIEERPIDDDAPALALRAGGRHGLEQALADALAGHLDQAQLGDVEDLRAGLVPGQGV